MIINGRDIQFRRTVKATCDVADICPEGDVKNLDKLFEGKYQNSQAKAAKFMAILSEGYEMGKKFADPTYRPNPLTEEEALYLSEDDFNSLFSIAVNEWTGGTPTVETKPTKSKKKATEQ